MNYAFINKNNRKEVRWHIVTINIPLLYAHLYEMIEK